MFIILIPLAVGLVAGWLVNYLADVLPGSLRLSQPECTNQECNKPFPWADYLLLKACPACGKRRYLRTVLIILLAVGSALYLWSEARTPFWLSYPVLVYLIIVATIDIEHRLVLLPLSITGVLIGGTGGIILHGWLATLIGAVAGFLIMGLLYLFGRFFSKLRAKRLGLEEPDEEALGSGDVTIATILGLLLGWPLIWIGLLLGILLAGAFSLVLIITLLITKKYSQQAMNLFIPYVPFFISSAVILLYLPNWIDKVI